MSDTIRIITDSACDIPVKTKLKNTEILNFYLTVDGKGYEERADFTNKEYYKILENCESIPTTAHITMMRFGEKFEAMAHRGVKEIIVVTINKGGSATYDAAVMAKNMFDEEHRGKGVRITVIASACYSMGYGYPIIQADKMIESGSTADSVIAYLEETFKHTEILLTTFSLRFMKKSGRISARAAFAGEVLGLKPIILMDHGDTRVVQKVRGDKMVIPNLIKQYKQRTSDINNYLIAYTDEEYGKELYSACVKEFGVAPIMSFELGAAVSTNAGNHCLAIVYAGKK